MSDLNQFGLFSGTTVHGLESLIELRMNPSEFNISQKNSQLPPTNASLMRKRRSWRNSRIQWQHRHRIELKAINDSRFNPEYRVQIPSIIGKMVMHLLLYMKSNLFALFDSIIYLDCWTHLNCYTITRIDERIVLLLSPYLMKSNAAALIATRVCLVSKPQHKDLKSRFLYLWHTHGYLSTWNLHNDRTHRVNIQYYNMAYRIPCMSPL